MKFLVALLLILLVGCRTPQDTSPAPINNNKMTQEMSSCGKQEVGLLGCFFNEKLEGSLVIPLWYKGEYQIKSERCGFLENKRYEGSQKIEVTYDELLRNKPEEDPTCLYNIKVFIDKFDNGFEGFFLLEKGDVKALQFDYQNTRYTGYAGIQLKETLSAPNHRLSFETNGSGRILWRGCELKGTKQYTDKPSIAFSEIFNGTLVPSVSCVMTVGLIPDDINEPVELAKVHFNVFEKTVVDLAEPAIEYRKGKLIVRADSLVAGIGIGDEYDIKTGGRRKKWSRDVPFDEVVDVRIMTSNGRFMLLKVKNGEVLWVK